MAPETWLETDAIRRASDIALGAILLIVGALALWFAPDRSAGGEMGPGAGFFPAVVAGLLCIVAVVLLARVAFRRSPPPVRPSRPLYVAIVAAAIVALYFALQTWGEPLFLRFGPPEFMALLVLELAIALALAHSSRIRAAGMAFLGLLLATVGVDPVTGVLRFTMGVEGLLHGIGADIVLFGVFVVGDAFVCLGSPKLFLRSYTRLVTAWQAPRLPLPAALAMRLAAVLAIAAACYYAYSLMESYVEIAWVLVFGVLGVAAKILGWNRFLLYMGAAFGDRLEQALRQTLSLAQGDPALLLQPINGTLLVAAIVILASAVLLSLRRAA
ncbi:MAG TPA: tripartite tricarboxylate transporter permease [Burkholderiales bacterium]|nr:tripartite tricarboxylate transporter permease [Burkholderiales bacterium]